MTGLMRVEGGSTLSFVRMFCGTPTEYLWEDSCGTVHTIPKVKVANKTSTVSSKLGMNLALFIPKIFIQNHYHPKPLSSQTTPPPQTHTQRPTHTHTHTHQNHFHPKTTFVPTLWGSQPFGAPTLRGPTLGGATFLGLGSHPSGPTFLGLGSHPLGPHPRTTLSQTTPPRTTPTRPGHRGSQHNKPENSKRAHFRAPALQKPHQNSTKRPPRERRKKEHCGGRGKKIARNFGPPTLLRPSPPRGPTLQGPSTHTKTPTHTQSTPTWSTPQPSRPTPLTQTWDESGFG